MKNKDYEATTTGNIFADLGIPNPEEHLAKVKLAMQIGFLIEKKRLNQKEAAALLGIDGAKIVALYKGKLSGFSIERLFRYLNILGQEITIKVSPKKRTQKAPNINVNVSSIKRTPASSADTRPAILAKKKNK